MIRPRLTTTGVQLTAPKAFVSLPVRWENAYGGEDRSNANSPDWDWVPAGVEANPECATHGLCELCYYYYYGVRYERAGSQAAQSIRLAPER